MKILTNAIFGWSSCALESADVAEYAGRVWQCGGKGGSPPATPDPYATANAQGGLNKDTAAYNNAMTHGNTTTPIGSQTYTGRVDPTTGATVYDQNVSLDPAQQKLLDQQTQQNLALGNTAQNMLGQVDSSYRNPIDTSRLPGLMSGADVNGDPGIQGSINTSGIPGLRGSIDTSGVPGLQSSINTSGIPGLQSSVNQSGVPGLQGSVDFSGAPALFGANDLMGARQQVQDALYKQQAGYLDPQWQQSNAAMESRLKNQGITQGSEAWNTEMDRQSRAQEAAYGQARNSAITGSGQELGNLAGIALGNRGQMVNEALNAGNFRNAANAQGFGQGLMNANLGNQANQQAFNQAAAQGQFANAANLQGFGQAATQADFGNQANQQGFGQAAQSGAFQNSAHAQAIADALSRANLNNSARSQGLQELFATRNQPLNEFNALRSASPVNMPQFNNGGVAQTNPADLSGNIWNAYNGNMGIYNGNQQAAGNNAAIGGSLAGAAIIAF